MSVIQNQHRRLVVGHPVLCIYIWGPASWRKLKSIFNLENLTNYSGACIKHFYDLVIKSCWHKCVDVPCVCIWILLIKVTCYSLLHYMYTEKFTPTVNSPYNVFFGDHRKKRYNKNNFISKVHLNVGLHIGIYTQYVQFSTCIYLGNLVMLLGLRYHRK